MSNKILKRLSVFCGFLMIACNSGKPLDVSMDIHPSKLQGDWFVIVHSPAFSTKCDCGSFRFNIDRQSSFVQKCSDANQSNSYSGKLEFMDEGNTIKLNYRSQPKESYQILHQTAAYRYLLLGKSNRSEMFILSKSPEAAALSLKDLLNAAEQMQFNTTDLIYPAQDCS